MIPELQQQLIAQGIAAAILEPGERMLALTGVRWGRSERPFVLLVPAHGEPAWILPSFEEGRAREILAPNAHLYLWHEDQSPYQRIRQALADRSVSSGRIAIDPACRFFLFDGLRQAAPHFSYMALSA